MIHKVADLHCDLLAFLAGGEGRGLDDPRSRSSLPQMRGGGVEIQVLPVYVPSETPVPTRGLAQIEAYGGLLREHGAHFEAIFGDRGPEGGPEDGSEGEEGRIGVALAIENASALFGRDEPVEVGLGRLSEIQARFGPLVYLSLTWALENRFGGGNGAQGVGLKEDGAALLEGMCELGIAADLSHTSDKLAGDILDRVNSSLSGLRVIASHSNLREVRGHARNLPDEIAQEIARLGGVIGLTLIKGFVGEGIEDFGRHVERALGLGLGGSVCLGTDFFCAEDLPTPTKATFFFDGYETAACHPSLQGLLGDFEAEVIEALVRGNLRRHLGGLARGGSATCRASLF